MNYIELRVRIEEEEGAMLPFEMYREILVASLGELDYESFTEDEEGVKAYVQESLFSEEAIKQLDLSHIAGYSFEWEWEKLEQKNWNAEWEKNFPMIVVGDTCCVRAPFHERPASVIYDIVIEPKMSFGTGHHETTFMMLEHLLEMELKDTTVLDMGCGTGVLGILTAMKGASPVLGIDIDEWSYENTIENKDRNQVAMEAKLGDASLLPTEETYDLILANINRNILLNDMEAYVGCLKKEGTILFSGFFENDIEMLTEKARSLGLQFVGQKLKNQWASLRFVK